MKVVGFIYARMSSNRLPGKVLTPLYGTTLLKIIIKKTESAGIKPILLTSLDATDDKLASYCSENKIEFYRGSLQNVALRTYKAIEKYKVDYFYRINGDSPFIQTNLITNTLHLLKNDSSIDLYTNLIDRTFPYGVAIELINAKTFVDYYPIFTDYNKEHITSYFYKNIEKFKIVNIKNDTDFSKYNLTIDTKNGQS